MCNLINDSDILQIWKKMCKNEIRLIFPKYNDELNFCKL